MLNTLKNMIGKADFFRWLIANGVAAIVAVFAITIAIRVYYLKIDKGRDKKSPEEIGRALAYEPEYFINSVMEIVVCNTCILGVLCVYDYLRLKQVMGLISEYSSLVLLVLILIAIGANRIIDVIWLDKEWTSGAKYSKQSLRMVSSIMSAIMWAILSAVFKSDQYVSVMVIMLGLVLGRFIFFDFSVDSLKGELSKVLRYWKSAIVAIILLIVMIGTGICFGIIQEDNVVVTLFIAHCLYLLIIRILKRVLFDLLQF